MSSASQLYADFVGVGAHIEPFAADDSEIDLFWTNFLDFMRINVNEPGFSLHDLPFAGQLVEGNAVLLDGGDHRRSLVKVTVEFGKGGNDRRPIENTHLVGFKNNSIPILSVGHFAQFHCSDVLFVFAHQKILDLGTTSDNDQEQTGRKGIKGPAMANLL